MQDWSVQVELWRGSLAWASTRTARPRAWSAWWSGPGGRSRRSAGQERTRFGRAREQCGKTGASAGPTTGGRGVTVQGNNVQSDDVQSDDVQGGDVQRMAVSPLGELRPRPTWCAGRSRAVREQNGNSAQEMQPGAAVLQEATRVCRPCFSGTSA
jgi:hypothetical protein